MFDRRSRRALANTAFIGFCGATTVIALAFLVAILWSLVINGVGGLNLEVFTRSTPAPGSAGGLANAIVGSLMLGACGMLVAIVIGILAGTWLAEYSRNSWYGRTVRFLNDILLSAPSILIGLFIYEVMVRPMK